MGLLVCVAVNLAVFGAAYRWAARRLTASRSQAGLDAAVLGYAVQYVAVGGLGMVGLLRPAAVLSVGMIAAVAMWIAGGKRRPARHDRQPVAAAIGLFAAAVAVGFAWFQADLPVLNNDALTYHLPAAVQWLQTGRIGLFPTWFFNPANGYSPLAGSTFIAWLIAPFGSDAAARFVQVPALLCVGLGVYRLGRELSAVRWAAASVAAAAVLCRPLLTAGMMAKDDLFVGLFFVAALVALSPDRMRERFGPARLGLAVGLLMATKYTALLAVPLLLPAVRRPRRLWVSGAIAAGLAGPWYVRNWVATGNPLFPVDLSPVFRGLFNTARSNGLASAIVGGSYGVPVIVAAVIAAGWLAAMVRRTWPGPALWACLIGPPVGVALFVWRSPFPEVRFLFPVVLMGLATAAVTPPLAVALLVGSLATITAANGWPVFAWLLPIAAAVAVAIVWAGRLPTWPRRVAIGSASAAVVLFTYARWTPYCQRAADPALSAAVYAASGYADDAPLWVYVNAHLPADATVAYADLYLVYPLQGPTLRRPLAYVPTRHGVRTPADLPWLGSHLSGERLVITATAATVAVPDRAQWLAGLRRLGASYLIVGRRAAGPEAAWATADPARFHPLYTGPGGWVFGVEP